jgi:hypothetical protein
MNYLTLKTLVTRNLGGRSDVGEFLSEWINTCYLDIITTGKLPELGRFAPIPVPELDATRNVVVSTGTVAQIPNWLFTISMKDTTNEQPLKQRSIQWYDKHHRSATAKCTSYTEYGGNIYLDPSPSEAFTLQQRYRRDVAVPALVDDTDVPIINTIWHELIEIGASYRGMRSLQDPGAEKWLAAGKVYMSSHSEQNSEEDEDAQVSLRVSF